MIAFAKTVFRFLKVRPQVHGAENVPRTGPAVMCLNHISYLDFTFGGYAALPARRYVRFMAKEAVFRHPIGGPLMRGMKHIPVDREAGAASFRAALQALKAGEIVGVFPEATISRSFELKEFKTGAVRLAQLAKAPLLPVVVWGSQRIWTKGRPRDFGRNGYSVALSVGEPMPVPVGAVVTDALADLKARMAALLARLQEDYRDPRGVPDPPGSPGVADRWWLPARLGGTAPTLDEADALDAR